MPARLRLTVKLLLGASASVPTPPGWFVIWAGPAVVYVIPGVFAKLCYGPPSRRPPRPRGWRLVSTARTTRNWSRVTLGNRRWTRSRVRCSSPRITAGRRQRVRVDCSGREGRAFARSRQTPWPGAPCAIGRMAVAPTAVPNVAAFRRLVKGPVRLIGGLG